MESVFKISKLGEFGLLIEGLESDSAKYLTENDPLISDRSYRWEHSVTINTLATVNAEGLESFKQYYVVDHEDCCNDRLEVQLDKDGLYRIAHIILPTRTWIDAYIAVGESFSLYDKIYFYDEGKFYIWGINGATEIEFADIYNELAGFGNTIIRSDKNTFAMYYLNNCFNTVVKDLLKDLPKTDGNCGKCSTNKYEKKVANRDILWMFINTIKYSLEVNKLYEAQRFLEKVNKCNGICGNPLKTTYNGCGC